jgi:hypothetical protein
MSEPITLYSKTGKAITVYGPAQAVELYAAGYRPTPPEATPEPEAAPEAKPEKPTETPETRPAPRKAVKRPKGGL